jgi:hypothetical protein
MRQEMGQDVSAACGQLAVDNKRKSASSSFEQDIEDNFSFSAASNQGLLSSHGATVSGLTFMEDGSGCGLEGCCINAEDQPTVSSSWTITDILAATAITTGVLLGAIVVYRTFRLSRSS